MPSTLKYLITVILESCEKINYYSHEFEDALLFFQCDEQSRFNATLMLLSNIGESVGKLSDRIKSENSDIKWMDIKNLRNRIAHDYTGIDYEMVFEIIKLNIPDLILNLYKIINLYLKNTYFDVDELNSIRGNVYYKHIDFQKITIPL